MRHETCMLYQVDYYYGAEASSKDSVILDGNIEYHFQYQCCHTAEGVNGYEVGGGMMDQVGS